MTIKVRKMIAVIGSGQEPYSNLSIPIGKWIAEPYPS
jgi:hypothetical protein